MDDLIEYLKTYIEPMVDKIYDELSSIHVTLKDTQAEIILLRRIEEKKN